MIQRYSKLVQASLLLLKDVATVQVNAPDSDFFLIRKGSSEMVGKPVKDYNPEHFGIKVTRTDRIDPSYLFYVFKLLHLQGYWQGKSHGSLPLQNIVKKDVENTPLGAN